MYFCALLFIYILKYIRCDLSTIINRDHTQLSKSHVQYLTYVQTFQCLNKFAHVVLLNSSSILPFHAIFNPQH